MKRFKLVPLALILAIILLLSGCSTVTSIKSKEFEKDGLILTLDTNFSEVKHESYTSAYESDKILVFTLKDNNELFASANYDSNMTLMQYAQFAISANGYATEPFNEDGLIGFRYNYSESGVDYTFVGFVFKGTDAYWNVHFGTKADEFESLRPQIFNYAKKVKIS